MADTQAADPAAAGFACGRIWLIGAGFLGVQVAFTLYSAFLPLMYREFFNSDVGCRSCWWLSRSPRPVSGPRGSHTVSSTDLGATITKP
jgi:hypothetical protein